jgi:hypothetical protein
MKKYGFYTLNDSNKEIINRIYTNGEDEAVVLFSKMKNLNIDDFLKLYGVIQIML